MLYYYYIEIFWSFMPTAFAAAGKRYFMNPNSELPWIIFDLNQQLYAISTEMVTGIAQMPFITSVAGAPETYLGVANIRGDIIPILDLKKLLKISSGKAETQKLMEVLDFKKKAAETYLKELRRCIREQDKFSVTRDVFGEDLDIGYTHDLSEVAAMTRNIGQIQDELVRLSDRVSGDKNMAAKAEAACDKFIHTINSAMDYLNNDDNKLIISLTNDPGSSVTCMGFVVDSVRAVDSISFVNQEGPGKCLFMAQIIGGVAHNDKIKGEILVVDDKQIESTLITYKESVKKAKEAEAKKAAEKQDKQNSVAQNGTQQQDNQEPAAQKNTQQQDKQDSSDEKGSNS